MIRNKIFLRFLLTFLLLIIIPLFIGMGMNGALVKEYENHVKQSYLSSLSKTQEILESYLEGIKWSTYQIANNTNLLRLISETDFTPSERSLLLNELVEDFNKVLLYGSSFNSTFYVYLTKQDIIITPYSIYSHSDFADGKTFFQMENISSNAWHEKTTSRYYDGKILPSTSTVIEDFKNKMLIPYLQTIPISVNHNIFDSDGVIVFLIGEDDMLRIMGNRSLPPSGWTYIADENGKIISSVNASNKQIVSFDLPDKEGMISAAFDSQEMLIIYTTSDQNNWKYVSVLPESWVLEKVRLFQLLTFVGMFIALVLSMTVASLMSYRWARPINEALTSIKSILGTESNLTETYQGFTSNVSKLINKSSELQKQSREQQIFVENAFLNRILNGYFSDTSELATFLNYLKLKITETQFSTALVRLSGYDHMISAEVYEELKETKILLKETLSRLTPIRILTSELNDISFAIIFMSHESSQEKHESIVNTVVQSFFQNISSFYITGLSVATGNTFETLPKINESFIQARETMDTIKHHSDMLHIHYKDVKPQLGSIYYPLEMENRLLMAVKSGDGPQVKQIFQTITKENFQTRMLNNMQKEILNYELLGSLTRIKNEVSENMVQEIDRLYNNDGKLSFPELEEVFFQATKVIGENKKSHNNKLIIKIEDYIKKNYTDVNLSLFMVATQFSITESYLSFFFKEQTGQNFSSFVEKIRIDKSIELLKTTEDSIHNIAILVGYNNDKTFRRVFRKLLGISPSEYRQELSSL